MLRLRMPSSNNVETMFVQQALPMMTTSLIYVAMTVHHLHPSLRGQHKQNKYSYLPMHQLLHLPDNINYTACSMDLFLDNALAEAWLPFLPCWKFQPLQAFRQGVRLRLQYFQSHIKDDRGNQVIFSTNKKVVKISTSTTQQI
jgi:hypothetical protein